MGTMNGWVASGATWEEIERAFLKVFRAQVGRIGHVDEVAHAVRLLVTSLERTSESMAA